MRLILLCRKLLIFLFFHYFFLFVATTLVAQTPLQKAKYAFSLGKWEQSWELFYKISQEDPINGEPHFYMGYIRERQNQKASSIPHYEQALELELDESLQKKCLWKLVLYYKETQNWVKLFLYSDKFLQVHDTKAIRKLHELAKQNYDPKKMYAQRLWERSKEEKKQGLSQERYATLEEAISHDSSLAVVHWELSLLKMKQGDFNAALRHLRYLTTEYPGYWHYHYKRAVCHYRLQEYEAALTAIEATEKTKTEFQKKIDKSENEDKNDEDIVSSNFVFYVNYMRGNIYIAQKEYPKAYAALAAALRLRPLKKIHSHLAHVHWYLGDYEKSFHHAKYAIAQKQKVNRSNALAFLYLSLYHYQKDEPEEGRELAEKMFKAKNDANEHTRYVSDYAVGYLILAEAAVQIKAWKNALYFLEKTNKVQYDNIAILHIAKDNTPLNALREKYFYYYATVLLHNQREAEALQYYAKIEEPDLRVYYEKALCYAAIKKSDQVKENLEKAVPKKSALTIQATNGDEQEAMRNRKINHQYWEDVREKEVFQKLMRINPEFSEFIVRKLEDYEVNQRVVLDQL